MITCAKCGSLLAVADKCPRCEAQILKDRRSITMRKYKAYICWLEDEIKRLKKSASIPEGWALVPIQPTPAMIDAAGMGWIVSPANLSKRLRVYAAMVAAGKKPA